MVGRRALVQERKSGKGTNGVHYNACRASPSDFPAHVSEFTSSRLDAPALPVSVLSTVLNSASTDYLMQRPLVLLHPLHPF